jgi:hypothetical protein
MNILKIFKHLRDAFQLNTLEGLYKCCLEDYHPCDDNAIIMYYQSLNFLINFITLPTYESAMRQREPLIALGSSLAPWFAFQDMAET